MIISRTPFRISFFGGGTDFPEWYNKYSGKVISTTINKYCYISLRKLPPFFKYNYRIKYHKTEEVKKLSQIKHPSVRESLKHFKFNDSIEAIHFADLPAQSGLGASSSFTVGFINSLKALQGNRISKKNLYLEAIHIEQKKSKEFIGSQDQVSAAFGGFNVIDFSKSSIEVSPVLNKNNTTELEKSIFLVFTGFVRKAQQLEKDKMNKMNYNHEYYKQILDISNKAEEKIYSSKNIVSDFSELLNKHWWYKKKLSSKVTNINIEKIYNYGIKNGAYSGKLLGAGAGGFMLFLINPKKRDFFNKKFRKFTVVPVKFDNLGSQIIYHQDNI
tara:strand:- start:234 stop:1220 length:987 start_codon:yes stop_codon:yes gene_type:complete